jgi:AcrR family transcriptional regulator
VVKNQVTDPVTLQTDAVSYAPPVPRRAFTEAETDDRRNLLLDAAVRVLGAQGDDATVSAIALEAGIAKGSFYTYFRSKEELVVALRERFVADVMDRATAIFDRVGREDLLDLADEMVASLVDCDLENRDVIKLVGSTSANPDLTEVNRKLQGIVEAGIRVGIAAGLFDVVDPWLTAGLLNHAIHGLVEEMILVDEDIDRAAVIAASQTLVRRALLPASKQR